MVKAAPHIRPPPSLSTLEEAVTGPESCTTSELLSQTADPESDTACSKTEEKKQNTFYYYKV